MRSPKLSFNKLIVLWVVWNVAPSCRNHRSSTSTSSNSSTRNPLVRALQRYPMIDIMIGFKIPSIQREHHKLGFWGYNSVTILAWRLSSLQMWLFCLLRYRFNQKLASLPYKKLFLLKSWSGQLVLESFRKIIHWVEVSGDLARNRSMHVRTIDSPLRLCRPNIAGSRGCVALTEPSIW